MKRKSEKEQGESVCETDIKRDGKISNRTELPTDRH